MAFSDIPLKENEQIIKYSWFNDLRTAGMLADAELPHRHIEDLSFDGSEVEKTVDVSATITNARNTHRQLQDAANDYDIVACSIKAISATQVKIEAVPALPAGTYRLIVIE